MTRQNIPFDPLKKDFIRLLTDFGFKRVFGSKERPENLKRLLNALFEGQMHISHIDFRDKEMLPENPSGKKTLYDIYCITDDGKHFILEMQQVESENFSDRMLFYVCRAIVGQGLRGVEYELDPVICVVITNFNMTGRRISLVKDMMLMDKASHEIYSENLRLVFLALPEVPEQWDDCDTELARLLFLIKNMEELNKKSKPYLSGEYDDIFKASSTDSLNEEEVEYYSQSYLKTLDNQSAVRFAEKKYFAEGEAIGIAKGEAIGVAKGKAEGELEKLIQIVNSLRSNGLDDFTIAKLINEPLDLISSL